MAENYVLLETIELSQSASSVTFDNLPTTGYTDLKIVTSLRGTVNLSSGYIDSMLTFNGITTGYTERMIYGLNGTQGAQSQSSTGFKWGNWSNDTSTPSNTFGNTETYIANYRSSTYKSVSISGAQESNASSNAISCLNFGVWANNSAITSITFTSASGSFAANSTLSLYGIAALNTTPVTAPFASGGNIVANDGTYWYHAFLSSGTFTPFKALSCDLIAVAGGASGGENNGGGGAGGLLPLTSQSLTAIAYTVTVGAGGAGQPAASGNGGVNGNNSQFGALTAAVGGGKGGSAGSTQVEGGDGGSGGGAKSSGTTVGLGTVGQGNNGGAGTYNSGNFPGGGGGGAGAVGGSAPNNSTAGSGGNGVNTYSSWASATNTGVSGFYAGGGGAGTFSGGTLGNGGAGGGGAATVSGIANTGGGGGGGRRVPNVGSGSGGSGIVIVRYPMV